MTLQNTDLTPISADKHETNAYNIIINVKEGLKKTLRQNNTKIQKHMNWHKFFLHKAQNITIRQQKDLSQLLLQHLFQYKCTCINQYKTESGTFQSSFICGM